MCFASLMNVMKFGGSSLASAFAYRQAAQIIQAATGPRVVVCSAPGKRSPSDTKMTDQLICLSFARRGEVPRVMNDLLARFEGLLAQLIPGSPLGKRLRQALRQALSLPFNEARDDQLKSLGEEYSARVLAAYLQGLGLPARFLDPGQLGLYVQGDFGDASVHQHSLERIAQSLADHHEGIVVVPGFYGLDDQGQRKTLSRGGSDVSAAWIAAACRAKVCEIWTDVSGVLNADPRLIKAACPIKDLSYTEVLALARHGGQVLHPDAVLPLQARQIPLRVRNSFARADEGTLIWATRSEASTKARACTGQQSTPYEAKLALIGEGLEDDPWLQHDAMKLLDRQGIASALGKEREASALILQLEAQKLHASLKIVHEHLVMAPLGA